MLGFFSLLGRHEVVGWSVAGSGTEFIVGAAGSVAAVTQNKPCMLENKEV
jgi:hypothetical protein